MSARSGPQQGRGNLARCWFYAPLGPFFKYQEAQARMGLVSGDRKARSGGAEEEEEAPAGQTARPSGDGSSAGSWERVESENHRMRSGSQLALVPSKETKMQPVAL